MLQTLQHALLLGCCQPARHHWLCCCCSVLSCTNQAATHSLGVQANDTGHGQLPGWHGPRTQADGVLALSHVHVQGPQPRLGVRELC